ncbi:MAG: Flp family type IVb pilin [Armatimonadota bacterium]|nr:Flp family type IVb pilin [Armatimonadota bacterium]MCX7776539.1 Flp family type IVb pilin [Armatimonadota bacterium]MDW8024338.1 Flp family type IVb pilin [Armatimonadota bacterium]
MVLSLVQDECGQTLLEYGLLVSLIGLVCIAILALLGERVRNLFVTVNSAIITR